MSVVIPEASMTISSRCGAQSARPEIQVLLLCGRFDDSSRPGARTYTQNAHVARVQSQVQFSLRDGEHRRVVRPDAAVAVVLI